MLEVKKSEDESSRRGGEERGEEVTGYLLSKRLKHAVVFHLVPAL